jgi:pSer/pThr/pTyr-binding forkhead associated (FHA) protein
LRLILYPGGHFIDVTRPEAVVGRHSEADVRLHLPDVSRRHCRLVFANGQWRVFDLHSLNGLFVNDRQVDQATLHHHDLVRIGSYIFEVDLHGDSAAHPLSPEGPPGNIASSDPSSAQRRAS